MLNNQAQLHRIQKIKPAATFWSLALLAIILLVGCGVQEDQPVNSETPIRLIDLDVTTGQTIYVPA
jgi:hypothetical protein